MTREKRRLVIGAGVLLLALSGLVYRGFVPAVREMPVTALPIESTLDRLEEATDTIPEGPGVDEPVGPHPLQSYVLSMPADARESLFMVAIRDAGRSCDDLLSAVQMAEAMPVWRVACVHAAAYLLEVDSVGQMRIDPLRYGEGPVPGIVNGPRALEPAPAPTPP